MTTPFDDKSFLKMVIEEFGEVLVHHVVFKNKDSAVSFFSLLSFIKQTSQGPSMPSHIKAFLLEASDGVSLSIAGKLKADESLEIRRKCLSASIKDEFYAIGKSQAVIAQNVNDQLGSDKNAAMQQQEHLKTDVQVYGGSHTLKSKNKTVAVLLAIFLSFWTWCYTYKKDHLKFWVNLGLFVVSIGFWSPIAWIWAIYDASKRPKEFYVNFNQSAQSQIFSFPSQKVAPQIPQQNSVKKTEKVSTSVTFEDHNTPSVVTQGAMQIQISFWKPIIEEAKGNRQIICSWEPNTSGWVRAEDDALVIRGASRFSFLENWLGLGPFGKIFIRTLFETIRQKERRVPYMSISKLVAAWRPHRSSSWDGGDAECAIIHVLIEENGKKREVCAFSMRGSDANTKLQAFWRYCSIRLGADKLNIRDEIMTHIL